jgi:hypothetical protein
MIYYKWISKALRKAIICVASLFSYRDTSQFVSIDQGLHVNGHSRNSSYWPEKIQIKISQKLSYRIFLKFAQ